MIELLDDVWSVKGVLDIYVRRPGFRKVGDYFEPTGEVVEKFTGRNVVTTLMKVQLAHLIVGDTPSPRYITKMGFGTGGHEPGDPSSPIAPSVDDVALEYQVYVKDVALPFAFPSATSVKITAILLEEECVGYTLTEAGLLCASNSLVARRTHGGLTKTNEFIFQYVWSLIW